MHVVLLTSSFYLLQTQLSRSSLYKIRSSLLNRGVLINRSGHCQNFSTFPENSTMQTPIDVPSYSTRNIDTRLPTTLNKYTPIEPFLLTRLPYSTASPTLAKYQHRLRDNSLLTVIRPFTKENINFLSSKKSITRVSSLSRLRTNIPVLPP